ncbi:DUF3105 domain-containing protein [Nocardioides marmoraquaticus]
MMSRHGQAGGASDRARRAEQVRAQQRRRERTRTTVLWAAVAVALALIVGATAYGLRSVSVEKEALATGVEDFEVVTDHVAGPVRYAQDPPAGGKHNGIWLNCGTYTEPVQSENAVHSMEHGASWVTYDPSLPEADVRRLADAMPSTYAILSPREDLPAPVVASSWGHQIELDGVDDPRLGRFLRDYTLADDVPEPGAACTSGTDTAVPLQGEPVEG